MSTVLTEQNVYAAQFSTMRERLPGSDLPWLERLRRKGIDSFLALGLPTTKLENWKYTNVAPIRRTTFQTAVDHPFAPIPEELRIEIGSYAAPRLVFVNGRFVPTFSSVDARLNFHLLNMSEALRDPERAAVIQKHLGRYTRTSDDAFAAWNTAFFTDGAYVEVPHGFAFARPINLVFVSAGTSGPWACYPRNLIVAGE